MEKDSAAKIDRHDDFQGRRAQIREGISNNYQQFQYRFVEFLSDHLADCSRVFKGDLQSVLLLAVIGQMALEGRNASGRKTVMQDGLSKKRGISAHRLSDISGIPRQTVRRKLEAMENKGWIHRDAQSGWRLAVSDGAAAVRRDLSGLDVRSIDRWTDLLTALEPLLQNTVEIPAQNEQSVR